MYSSNIATPTHLFPLSLERSTVAIQNALAYMAFLVAFLGSEVCFPALDVPSNQAWIGIFKQLSYSVT